MFKRIMKTIGVIGCTAGLLLPSMGVANAATPPAAPVKPLAPSAPQIPTPPGPKTSLDQANSSIFGPNVYVFDPSMSSSDIQKTVDSVFGNQEKNEFASQGYALLFKPGTYNVNVREGFSTEVAGLGLNPSDVTINGGVNADAQWNNANATDNFWRSVENLSVDPTSTARAPYVSAGTMQWAVSQMAPIRRVHVEGNLNLFDFTQNWNVGYASGGFMADSNIDGKVIPASQQQWLSRNNQYGSWSNGVWNMVFVGDKTPPSGTWPDQPYTVVQQTPKIAEEPYLYVDNAGNYQVFVPSLQENTQGVSWGNGGTPGKSLSINQFLIAFPNTPVKTINDALKKGKNLIFTPGTYDLNETIEINNPNTIVMGLGFPTLVANNGNEAISVGDVGGVKISGLIIDAGAKKSNSLMTVGTNHGKFKAHVPNLQNNASNPTILYDMTYRIGGARPGSTNSSLVINSDNVIGDNIWLWRADHGAGVGWSDNVDKNGLVVNGDDVTMYGLATEHHEQYQTLWNGNGGKVYFYQSEDPYDVPNQSAWMSHNGTVNGYASYKVADYVKSNEVWGIGVYSYFRDAAVTQNSAIEVPNNSGITINHMTTVWLNGQTGSEIAHVVNNLGGAVTSSVMRQTLDEYQGTGDTTK